MSKYIKLEDAISKLDEWFCEPYTPTELLSDLPTIEVSEDNQVLYGTGHNCILTLFGECSYNETGCGSCAVAEKIRKALEASEDCISRKAIISRIESERSEWGEDYDVEQILGDIEDAPSVVVRNNRTTTEQSSKVGEWIMQGISPYEGIQRCSLCDEIYNITEEFNYCPNCGAKMKGA